MDKFNNETNEKPKDYTNLEKTLKTHAGKTIKYVDMGRTWLYLVLGVALAFTAGLYYFGEDPAMLIIMIFIGAGLFLPVGLVLGWAFLSIENRARLKRKMTKKSYTVAHILGKGKHITKRLVNLDSDILVVKHENDYFQWVFFDKKVYSLDGEPMESPIDEGDVHILSGDVPCIFLSLDTMLPLSFQKETTTINPQHLAETNLAYIQNAVRKKLFNVNAKDVAMSMIIIFLVVVAIYFAYQNQELLNEIIEIQKSQGNIVKP